MPVPNITGIFGTAEPLMHTVEALWLHSCHWQMTFTLLTDRFDTERGREIPHIDRQPSMGSGT